MGFSVTGPTLKPVLLQLPGPELSQLQLAQANEGYGKQHGPRDVLAAAFCSPLWPGAANRGQWELRSAKPEDAAASVSCCSPDIPLHSISDPLDLFVLSSAHHIPLSSHSALARAITIEWQSSPPRAY
ncbi:hypothetical protein UY3_17477 [Chelonia mydas]|uniref:Uncharacterized protein n=1 Tax=Chelonia mydas TaxID=8469 RepID=M7BB55_CHEMY|nr:hypothetical protein UY3_17477 [Chelonia mydas]